jgi:CBS domain-containing protein
MRTVATILGAKGSEIFAVAPTASVRDALQILARKNIGALVVAEAGELVGIVSERDYAREVELRGRAAQDTTVAAIMSSDVVTVAPSASVEECMELMTERHIRHLPVLEDGELIGVISIGDVVKAMIADLAALVDQLDSYIRGA